mgnify:CR=1 FL=1
MADQYNGILTINKEKGYTSHDVVAILRKMLGQKKIGHTGTLDPDATGVLPVCLGNATPVSGILSNQDKVYRTCLQLGMTTDTQDATGKVLEERDISHLTQEEICHALLSFAREGAYDQIPPMYSALKVQGKKLVDLARKGIEVERAPRRVQIYDIRIEGVSPPFVSMVVHCSKGTYIRTLCHDMGQKLGVGGCMASLERIRTDRFDLDQALTLSQVESLLKQGSLEQWITPVEAYFSNFKQMTTQPVYDRLLINGNKLSPEFLQEEQAMESGEMARAYTSEGAFVGLYLFQGQEWKCFRMFHKE